MLDNEFDINNFFLPEGILVTRQRMMVVFSLSVSNVAVQISLQMMSQDAYSSFIALS